MTDMLTALREHGLSKRAPRRLSRHRASPRRQSAGTLGSSGKPFTVDLLPAVERDVIPRLHAALKNDLRGPRHPLISGNAALQDEIPEFADRMLSGELGEAIARVDALRSAGHSLECIYLKLLAPAACRLRDLWSDDFCGLADMTFALCNLQSVLRHYAGAFQAEVARPETGSRVLLVAPAGRGTDALTPMFGLILMSHFFRRDGWDALIERDLSCNSFHHTAGEWFDMVEVLAANDAELDEIASGIRLIRRDSPNPYLGVIVCGQIFSARPDYIGLVGADLAACDPLSSLSQARSLLNTASQAKSFATRQTEPLRLL